MKKLISLFFVVIFLLSTLVAEQTKLNPIIEAEWLNQELEKEDFLIVDLRTFEEFQIGSIPTSVNAPYFKTKWRETINGIPGLLPPKEHLQSLLQSLGVEKDSRVVVVYGANKDSDFGSAARVYWTFKTVGIQDVAILNGGYKAWSAAQLPFDIGENPPEASNFQIVDYDTTYFSSLEEVKENLDSKRFLAIDARPEEQFLGYKKHKKSKLGGTIPNATNISQFSFLDEKTGKLKSARDLRSVFNQTDLSQYEGVISFCNTGHWAATNWFVLSEILQVNTKLYDGSLVEWSHNNKNPLVNTKNRIQLWWHNLTTS